ncbi:MAG: IS1380 family transposase, partial [Gemmatimonadaceae bacterium]
MVELTPLVELGRWGEGTRMICRRERPHPGAQLRFTDVDGFRYQVFITDQGDDDLPVLEARHRAHARVEDRIRAAKQCGLENFPFEDFVR